MSFYVEELRTEFANGLHISGGGTSYFHLEGRHHTRQRDVQPLRWSRNSLFFRIYGPLNCEEDTWKACIFTPYLFANESSHAMFQDIAARLKPHELHTGRDLFENVYLKKGLEERVKDAVVRINPSSGKPFQGVTGDIGAQITRKAKFVDYTIALGMIAAAHTLEMQTDEFAAVVSCTLSGLLAVPAAVKRFFIAYFTKAREQARTPLHLAKTLLYARKLEQPTLFIEHFERAYKKWYTKRDRRSSYQTWHALRQLEALFDATPYQTGFSVSFVGASKEEAVERCKLLTNAVPPEASSVGSEIEAEIHQFWAALESQDL